MSIARQKKIKSIVWTVALAGMLILGTYVAGTASVAPTSLKGYNVEKMDEPVSRTIGHQEYTGNTRAMVIRADTV